MVAYTVDVKLLCNQKKQEKKEKEKKLQENSLVKKKKNEVLHSGQCEISTKCSRSLLVLRTCTRDCLGTHISSPFFSVYSTRKSNIQIKNTWFTDSDSHGST